MTQPIHPDEAHAETNLAAERRRYGALNLPGLRLAIVAGRTGLLHLHSDRPLRCLSSASCGGDWSVVHDVLNAHVDKSYNSESPGDDLKSRAREIGLREPFVGVLTAVYVETAGIVERLVDGLRVAVVATAGVGNATAAGCESPWRPVVSSTPSLPTPQAPGTINVVVIVDADLAPEALVNLVMTVTEAKTMTLVQRGIRTSRGSAASGTSTDAVVVGCTGGPAGVSEPWSATAATLRYAGPLTLVGHLAAECTREAISQSLDQAVADAPGHVID